jgi:pimeloyl-ACP methyl ester carboxylesterase
MSFEVDGKRVFATTGGHAHDPSQPLVVFLHGAGMDHSVFALQSRWFAHHGWRVLAVDTALPTGPFSPISPRSRNGRCG